MERHIALHDVGERREGLAQRTAKDHRPYHRYSRVRSFKLVSFTCFL